jgi:uncharacterized protein (TIGR02001 family)
MNPASTALIAVLAAALALPAAAAQAQDAPNPSGGFFSFVDVTSDYRYQGVSNTDGGAAIQGNLHYWRPDGWYAGLFATQVDFKDPRRTSYELDWYGGKNLELEGGKTELKLQLMYSAYPDNRTFGPTYDFLTGEVALKHVWGKLTASSLFAFTPQGSYRSGKIWRTETEADYALTPGLTLKALAGDQWGGRDHTRAYWSLGAATRWKALGFDLRYVDTDLGRADCPFLPKTCGPELVGTLTVNLPPFMF